MATTRIVSLNLDTLIAAMEARPETKHRRKAWEYLAEVSSVQFDGDALIVPSATWFSTTYRTTSSHCSCPCRKRCHHQEILQIVTDAIELDALYDSLAEAVPFDLGADLATYPPRPVKGSAAYHDALSDLLECFV